jgi:hypothetical protein
MSSAMASPRQTRVNAPTDTTITLDHAESSRVGPDAPNPSEPAHASLTATQMEDQSHLRPVLSSAGELLVRVCMVMMMRLTRYIW